MKPSFFGVMTMIENLEKIASTKSFDKLTKDAQNYLEQFEAEIRADEREKVIAELIEQGRLELE